MNRADLQLLAAMRLNEAQGLLALGFASGAYYLGGYAVECALKACIAKLTREFDFPPIDTRKTHYVHDFKVLLGHAGLDAQLSTDVHADPQLGTFQAVVWKWKESVRYDQPGPSLTEAADFLTAVSDPQSGVFVWLQKHW